MGTYGICGDGASKYPVYVIPNLQKMVEDNKDITRVAFSIAAYRHYLKYKKDDKGNAFEIFDPWLTESDLALINSDNAADFLETSVFQKAKLAEYAPFVEVYSDRVEKLKSEGALPLLENILVK